MRGGRKIAAHHITASDFNTITITLLIKMRMKFVHDHNLKSDDELINLKETFRLCEGRAEQHYYIPVRTSLVNSAPRLCGTSFALRRQQSRNWPVEYVT